MDKGCFCQLGINMKNQNYKFPLVLLSVWLALAFGLGITAKDPLGWLLEFIPLFLVIIVLALTIKNFRFSNISYSLIFIFFLFPIFAAHYSYSDIPFGFFNSFFNTLFLSQGRNNFDRLVHFSAGILLSFPVYELLKKKAGLKSAWLWIITVLSFVGVSAIYEILEWLSAYFLSPVSIESFVGLQGDIWDAQKDMLITSAGSFISMPIIFFLSRAKKLKDKLP